MRETFSPDLRCIRRAKFVFTPIRQASAITNIQSFRQPQAAPSGLLLQLAKRRSGSCTFVPHSATMQSVEPLINRPERQLCWVCLSEVAGTGSLQGVYERFTGRRPSAEHGDRGRGISCAAGVPREPSLVQRRAERYVERAVLEAVNGPACAPAHRQSTLPGPPPLSLRSILGVLRGPRSPLVPGTRSRVIAAIRSGCMSTKSARPALWAGLTTTCSWPKVGSLDPPT
jgi:hypothetical protein